MHQRGIIWVSRDVMPSLTIDMQGSFNVFLFETTCRVLIITDIMVDIEIINYIIKSSDNTLIFSELGAH
jgi:hypothetical protein